MHHSANENHSTSDCYNLNRFLEAQEGVYEIALFEIQQGRKRSHWMWFIFPQLDGLAYSSTASFFAITSRKEASAYLDHPVLGTRLIECCEALLRVEGRTANQIFGSPDDLKLCSSATLFEAVAPLDSVFERVLDNYYSGVRDSKTLELLGCE